MSQQSISLMAMSIVATAAITSRRFVTAAGAHGTAGAAALGVSQSDAAIGERVSVDIIGTAVVEASEAITANAFISVAANGKAQIYADGEVCVGQAAPGATAAGDGSFLEVMLLQSRPLQVIA